MNLIMDGLPEAKDEDQEQLKREITHPLKDHMKIEYPDVDLVHRIGKVQYETRGKPWSVIILFKTLGSRNTVWMRRSNLKGKVRGGTTYGCLKTSPRKSKTNKNKCGVFLMARNHGKFGRVKLNGSVLYLDGRAYSKNNIRALPKWLWPEEIATIENDDTMVFYTKDSPYSNHHKSPFTMEGKSFTTMENYIALQRCRIARWPDLERGVWREVLRKEGPVKLKQVIRQ